MQLSRQDLTNLFIRHGQDWSSKTIAAALDNKGVDVATLERMRGLKPGAIRNVFYRHVPAYESAIAEVIGVAPELIWPSRYRNKNPQDNAA
ncbi:transcriptional regulator [Salmonella enterica subsp. enterica serovar Newport]|nr:transcriptional regulator [Salmonella enterica subsp. salamae]EAZ1916639.1 transcriptional regulator [Salmonella enterica]ECA2810359.1 transcriptional regulator [Salmonella enterica subsp. enterica serovar Newport]ECC3382308.1 transcriptional regulator [Salmonella enterica subsp. enterica serovar Manchester]ECO0045303.1 transcriptional regulator [Salmonella enterica subsp. enterica serovar Infantis]EDG5395804.1 transcriptional regulator [Salmonella enterica subsp. enterica serovar Bovismorb